MAARFCSQAAGLARKTLPSHRLDGVDKRKKTLGAHPRHCHLTNSVASTNVPRLIRRGVDLAPVRKHGAPSSSRRAPYDFRLASWRSHPPSPGAPRRASFPSSPRTVMNNVGYQRVCLAPISAQ
jgi:hypothetical protein